MMMEIFYAAIFLFTDMTTERWGEEEARHVLWLVIVVYIFKIGMSAIDTPFMYASRGARLKSAINNVK